MVKAAAKERPPQDRRHRVTVCARCNALVRNTEHFRDVCDSQTKLIRRLMGGEVTVQLKNVRKTLWDEGSSAWHRPHSE